MSEETLNPGTTAGEGVSDEAEASAATPETTDGGGEAEQPSTQQLLDELNALKAQLSNLPRPEAVATPPTADQPSFEDGLRQQMATLQEQEADLAHEIAILATRGNDPLAKAVLQQKKALQLSLQATAWGLQQTQEKVFEMELPADDRAAFREFKEKNRHRFGDLDAMRDAFDGQRARQSLAEVQKTKARAEEVLADRKRGVVATGTREVPAAEMRERKGVTRMTESAFDTRVEQLRATGDHDGARALLRQATQGLIELV